MDGMSGVTFKIVAAQTTSNALGRPQRGDICNVWPSHHGNGKAGGTGFGVRAHIKEWLHAGNAREDYQPLFVYIFVPAMRYSEWLSDYVTGVVFEDATQTDVKTRNRLSFNLGALSASQNKALARDSQITVSWRDMQSLVSVKGDATLKLADLKETNTKIAKEPAFHEVAHKAKWEQLRLAEQ